jgi:hypothetical protein
MNENNASTLILTKVIRAYERRCRADRLQPRYCKAVDGRLEVRSDHHDNDILTTVLLAPEGEVLAEMPIAYAANALECVLRGEHQPEVPADFMDIDFEALQRELDALEP